MSCKQWPAPRCQSQMVPCHWIWKDLAASRVKTLVRAELGGKCYPAAFVHLMHIGYILFIYLFLLKSGRLGRGFKGFSGNEALSCWTEAQVSEPRDASLQSQTLSFPNMFNMKGFSVTLSWESCSAHWVNPKGKHWTIRISLQWNTLPTFHPSY